MNCGAIDWRSSKQSTVAQSTTKAEYIAASEAAQEAVWIKKFVAELGVVPNIEHPMKMYCDNSSVIILAKESRVRKGSRHILRKFDYIHEVVERKEIDILKVHTDENLADPFTKPMTHQKHDCHASSIGLRYANDVFHL